MAHSGVIRRPARKGPVHVPARPDPPAGNDGRGGGGSEWVELVKARNDIDAHLLMGRLAEAGVEARTLKERGSSPSWLTAGSNPWAPVMVLVRRFDLDSARLVLAEVSFEAPAAEPHACAPQQRSIPILWWSLAVGLGILLTAGALAQAQGAPPPACPGKMMCAPGHVNP